MEKYQVTFEVGDGDEFEKYVVTASSSKNVKNWAVNFDEERWPVRIIKVPDDFGTADEVDVK
jgi:hypothetical protein